MDGGLTDSIRMVVQWVFVPLLAFAVFAWLCLKIESSGVFETIRSAVRRMSAFQRFAAAAFLAVFIVFASEKTNSPPANVPSPVLPPVPALPQEPPRSGTSEVTNLCFTGISISSNGMAHLSLAWPTNTLFAGDIVDLFATTSLVGAAWGWVAEHGLAADTETNWTEIVDTSAVAGVSRPPAMFFSASVRVAPDDLRDTDGDTIPDAYEVHNGSNPYTPDYAIAQKLVVDPSGQHPTIASALAASTDYSIIELDPATVHDVFSAVHVPAHPVMICSPPGTCAVVRATQFAAFLLDTNVTSRTLFKNLYVLLDARFGYQAAFFVGGYLPQLPVAASATFEDIYVRMPNPGVEYFGWLLYTSAEDLLSLSRCTVNAAGSEWVYGVQDFGTAPVVLDRCSFVNFPPNGAKTSCGILTRSSSNAGGGAEVSVSRTVFDESFTDAIMVGRLENGTSNILAVADCIVPRELPPVFPLESVSGIVVTNAALSWAGFPLPDSPSVALGMGALSPLADDPAADMDGDGLSDYNEVYELGTDPYLVDTDRDGVADGDEIGQWTDPADPHSFLQNLTVTVTNTVSLSHAAYLAWGYDEAGWEANELVVFPTGTGSNLYVNASSNGAEYVKAFCDLDDDGEFSAATDILIVRHIPPGAVAHIDLVFGDVDGDGVSDEQERSDGTDPYDGGNFKVNLSAQFVGVFHTTNALSVQVTMNTNVVYGPIVLDMTNRIWTFGPQSLTAVTGGHPTFAFWDDANCNGVREAYETAFVYTHSPFSHDMAFSNRLAYGSFDNDNDGMLDWWELQHGLSPTNAADAVEDLDGDTLLNVHEFLSETDPHVYDGTNTLIYSLIHSIDDRLVGKSPQANWKIYEDDTIATRDTNCWLYGVSLPSTTQQRKMPNSDVWTKDRATVVIGNQHLLYSAHCPWTVGMTYRFVRPGGEIVERTLLGNDSIHGTDIAVGIIDEPLPPDFPPVKFLSADFAEYIGNGRYLPAVRIDQWSRAVVQEINTLPSGAKNLVAFRTSDDEWREMFRHDVEFGDSAHPNFLLLGTEVVYLFSTWQQQNNWHWGTGCLTSLSAEEIETKVNAICTANGVTNLLKIQQYDFSSWRNQ